ncbi:hypothetical protein PJP12_29935, partial [Mycobacterium kansasii]
GNRVRDKIVIVVKHKDKVTQVVSAHSTFSFSSPPSPRLSLIEPSTFNLIHPLNGLVHLITYIISTLEGGRFSMPMA